MKDESNMSEQDALIQASWDRCKSYGLEHHNEPEIIKPPKSELEFILNEHQVLVNTTDTEVLPYYENILSNTQCLILLADAQGQLLNSWGDQRFLNRTAQNLFSLGVNWEERVNGTNAIGTALATGHAVQVQRDEHFLKSNRCMIGSAAPIYNAKKELIGVLDVSSDAYLPQAHTFGLVKLMSQSVENRLLINHFNTRHFVLTFNTHIDNIDSPWSGLIIFDDKGTIISANRRAELILGHDIALMNVTNLFDCKLTALKNHPENLAMPLFALNKYQMLGVVKRPAMQGINLPDFREDQALNLPLASPPLESGDIPLARLGFGDKKVEKCIRQAERVIGKEIPILIHGETGVGKEVFVKALHEKSARRSYPLVAVNCAAIPSELVESELFGYEKGAFTGANSKGGIGLIRKANKGTLFLDEIGEMPLKAQARLLRVLQERKVTPLGSTESYPVDIKVISATNRSLRDEVEKGLFRQDLYYRVSGLNLELPPLRDRTDRTHLFREIHRLHRAPEQAPALSARIITLFDQHPWPGNIRQLVSVIKIALAMADNGSITEEDLPDDFFEDIRRANAPKVVSGDASAQAGLQTEAAVRTAGPDSAAVDLDCMTLEVYREQQGNISRTAKILGISRNTLYKRLRNLGIK